MRYYCRFYIGHGGLHGSIIDDDIALPFIQNVGFREEQICMSNIRFTCESDNKGGIGNDCFPPAEAATFHEHKESLTKESYQGESREPRYSSYFNDH